MKKILVFGASAILVLGILASFNPSKKEGFVTRHGQLSVKGIHILDKDGKPFQMRGMSLFWSQWMGQFYNKGVVKNLARDWKSSVIRAAMGADKSGSYLEEPQIEQGKVETVVNAAIKEDIYVLIDWHSHKAEEDVEEAKKFFTNMAKKYGEYPNVIYEIYNEPLCGWDEIKAYAEPVIAAIRKHDPDNIIIVGTPVWSQRVDKPALDPIEGTNIVYTLHFYAATHKKELRDIGQQAVDAGICLFVTEFGTCKASGDGEIDFEETDRWMEWMDKYHISWCNWSIADKNESASALMPEASSRGVWIEDLHLTKSGKYIKKKIQEGKDN